jgi:hypothetical protein
MHIFEKTQNFIASLSFNEYVLIDCLKFGCIYSGLNTHLCNLYFVALTEQGFINIFDEITNLDVYKFTISLLLDRMKIYHDGLTFIIRYVSDKEQLKELIEKPGLDFYKCYYDGIKIHSTPEANQ